ncbi:hypothetical protein ACS0TY_030565 [Phlomoides rotata]
MNSMIILHEYPLNMVEHFGFRRFMAALQPLSNVVSRNTVKSDIMKIYDFEKDKIMKVFDKNSSKFAIIIDMWTTNNQKKGYMAITTHFIDESWKLQSRLVRFIYVPCPHTSAVICDALVDCLMDWNLDHKLSTLTLDNCSTNYALINDIFRKLDKKAVWLDGSLLHMRCCAHILNLIVRDGLDVIEKPTIMDMATKMLEKFEKYWSQINGIMGVATVLDPRYKLKLLHYYFPLLYSSEDAKKEIERIKEICVDLVNEYYVKFKASGGIGGSFQSLESSFKNPDEVDSMSNYDKFVTSETEHDTFKTELDSYLEERVLPRNVNVEFDILSWWKNSLKYPILQLVAQDVLAIPISTVASESTFNTSGRFVSPHRSRLHHDTLEALMCSQDWLWAASKGIGASATTRSECSTVLDDVDNEKGEEVPELDMDAFETEL